jgi:hypothetical protein
MSIDAYVVGALAVLAASGGASGSVPDAKPRILSDETLACMWVHISEDLKFSPSPPDTTDQDATGVLMSEVSRRLRAQGYSPRASNGRGIVTPEFAIGGPNPQCEPSTAYRAKLTYDALPKRQSFRATLSIKRKGELVLFEQNDFDFRKLPQTAKVNPLQVYLGQDLRSKASRMPPVLLNSRLDVSPSFPPSQARGTAKLRRLIRPPLKWNSIRPIYRDIDSTLRKLERGEVEDLVLNSTITSGRMPLVESETFRSGGRYFLQAVGGVTPFQTDGTYTVNESGELCIQFKQHAEAPEKCRFVYRGDRDSIYLPLLYLPGKAWLVEVVKLKGE